MKISDTSVMITKVENIELKDIDPLIKILLTRVRSSNFKPDFAVYLETGARLLAASLYENAGIPVVPITIQRSGSSAKTRIATLLAVLPRKLQDLLRQLERQFLSRSSNKRQIAAAPVVDLTGKAVLILDDAADSGESLLLAKKWAIEMGADEACVKFATISVTQISAQKIVDYWIYPQMCRFPWSSDSKERAEYIKIYEQTDPRKFKARNF